MQKQIEVSADEATMMMLGLYEDTGSLTFHTTTVRDYQAAAYLLEHGANLNVVADLIVQELTPDQVRLLNDLIASRTILNIHGINIAIAHASIDHFVGDIATLAHKLKDMENLDVLFIVIRMESRVFIVARSRLKEVHAGDEDGGALGLRLVQEKVGVGAAVLEITPVVEQILSEALLVDRFQEAGGDDLIGIDVADR